MDKLYTQSYQNLVRNMENTSTLSTYVFDYSTAYYGKILMLSTTVLCGDITC